jgi:hypothetical protein
MNAITTPAAFNFQTHAVRTIVRDGAVWFVAVDVCNALGYANTSKAIGDHLDADEKANESLGLAGSPVNIINESGLYALVLRSRKPEARKFAKWVTAEVLPAIRKTGGYSAIPAHASPPAPRLLMGNSPRDLYFAALKTYAGNYTNKSALWIGLSEVVFAKLGITGLDGITHENIEAAIHAAADDMAVNQYAKQFGQRYLLSA